MFGKIIFCFAAFLMAVSAGEELQTCPCCGHPLPAGYVLTKVSDEPSSAAGPAVASAALPVPAPVVQEEPPAKDWKAGVYGGFTAKSGNTEEKAYRYGVDYEKKNGKLYRYRLKLDGKYRETAEAVSDSKAELSGEMRRLTGDRWFISGRVSALHDDLKDISYRTKIGPGIGRYLADSDNLTSDVSTGLLYIREKTTGEPEDYIAGRLSQRFDWWITDTIKWWMESDCFVGIPDTRNFQLSFKTGIDNKLNEYLSLVIEVEDEYDNLPDRNGNIKKNDLEISTGLRYKL